MSDAGVNWPSVTQISQLPGTATANANAALDLANKQRALNALRGVNLSDSGSVQNALSGLVQLGMVDQAKGLTDLAQTRALNQAKLPVAQNAFGAANDAITAERAGAQSSQGAQPQPTPAQLQQAQQTMQAASNAITTIKAAPANQRLDAWNATRQQFAAQNIPTDALDAVGQHLSDSNFSDESLDALTNHYAEHAGNFGAMAGGAPPSANLSTHPTNAWNAGAASPPVGYQNTQQLQASDPNIANAQADLNSPLRQPLVQGAITEATGIDQGPGYQQDIALTAPARSNAANAAFAGTTAASTTTATNIANLNTLPQVTRAVAEASARGAAAGSPMEITLPSGATQKGIVNYDDSGRPYFVPIGQAPAASGAAGPPISSPTIAQHASLQGGAQSNVDQANAFEQYTGGYPARKANLENLRTAAAQIPTGPQAPFWGHLGALAAEYGVHLPIGPNATGTANFEEVRKVAAAVLAQQKDTLGLPNTNQSVTLATGATPGEETSPLGIQRLAGLLEGNEDYGNAQRQAWDKWKAIPGNGRENFQDFVPQWNKMFDPRVFQAQYFDPAERAIVAKQIPNFAAQEKVAKRLGYIAGQ